MEGKLYFNVFPLAHKTIAMFFRGAQQICERLQTVASECKCFVSECNISWGNRIVLQEIANVLRANAKFLGMQQLCDRLQMFCEQMQRFSGKCSSFARDHKCFVSERNISWGNTIVLQEIANVLRANRKFLRGTQQFCERSQMFCDRLQMFCERTQRFTGEFNSFSR